MIHGDIQLLIAPYVLGTASDEERRMVEQHALLCHECRAHIADFEQVSVGLAFSAVSEVPRPELRNLVMEAISDAVHAQAEADRAAAAAAAAIDAPRTTRRPALWRDRLMRWVFVPAVPVLATGCLVLGVLWINARGEARDLRSATPDITSIKSDVVTANAVAGLQTTGLLSTASGSVVTSGEHGYVVLRDMPAPPTGKAWQAWIVRPELNVPKVSLGVMNEATRVAVIPLSVIDGDIAGTFAVTLEPVDGSKHPTSNPIAVVGYSLRA